VPEQVKKTRIYRNIFHSGSGDKLKDKDLKTARYGYSVWLRHLSHMYDNGLHKYPINVAELGPGKALSVGIAALISGSEKYIALDLVPQANISRNVEIFREMVILFKRRTPIPSDSEFPKLRPKLENYAFPSHILTESHLDKALEKNRLGLVLEAIIGKENNSPFEIKYCAPWYNRSLMRDSWADLVLSQAVMEHVDELDYTYNKLNFWLRKGGCMSHTIDYKDHGFSIKWNGYWAYNDILWKIIRGKHNFAINRCPHSYHLKLIDELDLEIVKDERTKLIDGILRSQLSEKFQSLSDEDLQTSGGFVQALKVI